ncbi:hypothetical protein [Pelagicoccus mobilis]|uniref:VPDSG-CTERM protein sorting domain-containing protein n=1 Tax=Pelagicoccus mobilis TaxID=415221 RepID=A0A934RVT9_9BACT|nr:hypothetical protein [Pelagicoccus mobilis]MBK1877742.1 hypothetical protein [Pelagicoccus mobilis]
MKLKSKLTIFLVAAAGIAPLADAAMLPSSGNVKFYDTPNNNQSNGGGEFRADILEFGTSADQYTFCLEVSESIKLDRKYRYTIDTAATSGGKNLDTGTPGRDTISKGTAFLFELFAKGALLGDWSGFSGFGINYTANRVGNSALMQKAIWALEDEKSFISNPTSTSHYSANGNIFLDLAIAQNGSSFTNARMDFDPNTTGVRVMNIEKWSRRKQKWVEGQSQLVWDPSPVSDSGTTATLMLAGLIGLAAIRRKTRQ